MSTPHYNNGRLLLKDAGSSNWYYVDVGVVGEQPYLQIAQVASITGSPSFAEFVTIQATNGDYYRIQLSAVGGTIYEAISQVSSAQVSRVFLKSGAGTTYELKAAQSPDGLVYLALQVAGTNLATLDLPWHQLTSVLEDTTKRRSLVSVAEDTTKRRSLVAVTALPKTSVVIPA